MQFFSWWFFAFLQGFFGKPCDILWFFDGGLVVKRVRFVVS